ncbi:MAG TPA: hypothetical protein ENI15_04225 [Spirochaetes bacterium]|nr:hypothetical protein [Spirochaetota bacterium]
MNLNTGILSDDKNMFDTGKTYLGVIFAHRPGFPEKPVADARKIISKVFKKLDIYLVSPGVLQKNASSETSEYGTQLGAVSNYKEAKLCAELFKKHVPRLHGLIICLANFGDERAVADVIRYAGLDVPVLVHALPDHEKKMGFGERKDAYCGKISVYSSLKQYGIPFTLTGSHVVDPVSQAFTNELKDFLKTCRIVI